MSYAINFQDYISSEGYIDIRKWVPDGLVHVTGRIANRHVLDFLEIPHVPALTGFRKKGDKTVPRLRGRLIHEEDYPRLESYREELEKKRVRRSLRTRKPEAPQRTLADLWHGLPQARRLFIDGPTSSGKTHTALEMARDYNFVGVAVPIKALAYEIYIRLRRQGLNCHLHTGDCHLTELHKPQFVVGTYECLVEIEAAFELLIVDEVHWVEDAERGGVVSKLLRHPNLIVMSASVEPFAGFEVLSLTGKTRLHFHEGEEYLGKPGDVVIEFCNSINDCMAYAKRVAVPPKYRGVYERPHVFNVYHGNLTPTERLLVQEMFVRGDFHYLYATDAAAQGINLPANVVIIPEVNYKGEPHSDKVLRQMAGRCARYGQKAEGHVYLIKKPKTEREAIVELPLYQEKTLGDLCRGRIPICFVGADPTIEVRGAQLGNAIELSSRAFQFFTYGDFARYQYEFAFLSRVKDQIRPKYREYIEENRQLFLNTFSPKPMLKLLTH